MDHEKTGKLIAARRNQLGLTQKELAQQLHVSDRAVSRWERGVGFPDISTLEPLADALEVTVLELLHGELSPEPERAANEDLSVRDALHILGRHSKRELGFLGAGLKVGGLALFWIVLLPALVFTVLFYRPAKTEVSAAEWTAMDVCYWGDEYTDFQITDRVILEELAKEVNSSHYRKRLKTEAPDAMTADIALRSAAASQGLRVILCDNGDVFLFQKGLAAKEVPSSGKLYCYLWDLLNPYIA